MRREHRVISALARQRACRCRTAVDLVDDTADGRVTGTVFFVMELVAGDVLAHPSQNAAYTAAGLRALEPRARRATSPSCTRSTRRGRARRLRPPRRLPRPAAATWRRSSTRSRSRDDARASTTLQDTPRRARCPTIRPQRHRARRLSASTTRSSSGAADAPHISAILDWEMATLGDPLVDLGMLRPLLGHPRARRAARGVAPQRRRPGRRLPGVRRAGRRLRGPRRASASRSSAGTARSPRTSSP